MRKGYTKLIRREISHLGVGQFITPSDFPKISRASVVTILNRIVNEDETFVRIKRGVFTRVKNTKFGLAKSTPLEILIHEIENDENKCFGGAFLFNQLGLTTQVPATIEILNNKSRYSVQLGQTTIRYSIIRPKIEKNNKSSIMLLEVIKKINSIPDSNFRDTIGWLNKTISNLTLPMLKQLVKNAYSYTPRTRAILGTFLSKYHPTLANKIRLTLKDNSSYTIGILFDYLNEPTVWRLKR